VNYDVLPPGSSIAHHGHDPGVEEIYFILEGEGLMTVDDEERIVVPGDMILTSSGHSHGLSNRSETRLAMVAIKVSRGFEVHGDQP
jgi:mannose-6-phosphate isomerase-like protein (cupin superfamily)